MRSTVLLACIVLQATLSSAAASDRFARIELVAGGESGADDSSARDPKMTSPFGVGFDSAGTLYFVEMVGNRVCRLGPTAAIITVAGTGQKGSGGDDGPVQGAELNGPHSLAVAANGDIYVADTWNNRVRRSMDVPAASGISRALAARDSRETVDRPKRRNSVGSTVWPSIKADKPSTWPTSITAAWPPH